MTVRTRSPRTTELAPASCAGSWSLGGTVSSMSAAALLLVPLGFVNVPFPADRMQRLETAVAQLNATDAVVISTVAGLQGQFAAMQSRLSRVEAFVDMKPPALPPLVPPPSPSAPRYSLSATQLTNTNQLNPTGKTVVAAWKHRFSTQSYSDQVVTGITFLSCKPRSRLPFPCTRRTLGDLNTSGLLLLPAVCAQLFLCESSLPPACHHPRLTSQAGLMQIQWAQLTRVAG
jgi:hypothetical protein